MKKLFILVTLVAGLALNGCQDKGALLTPHAPTPSLLHHSIQNLTGEQQVKAFNGASARERYTFWQTKLANALKLNWNKAQKTYLQSLMTDMKPEWFDFTHRTLESESRLDLYLEKRKAEGLLLFNHADLKQIVAEFRDYTIPNYGINLPPQTATSACQCSKKDDWCSSRSVCADALCGNTAGGCGWWKSRPCTGNCSQK